MIKHIIMGTAGHIDHGKTTLIKALTGKETDYIKEEKERGISIDIGFAPFRLPDGRTIGVIDVPGHEKFIKNMLAGIGGIDFVLLIIDANEGIMPQTVEHFHILHLLGIKKAVIVLTKVDLADADWVEFVKEEVREHFASTVFKDAPIVEASPVTGQGMELLKQVIADMADQVETRETMAAFRMPVDRIFSIAGFGTVVTGTALSGTINIGDKLELLPEGLEGRVRGIQHHNDKAEAGYAGQRLAINITGIDSNQVARGMVVAEPKVYRATKLLDVRIKMIDPSSRNLLNRSRVRVYVGSSEILARVVLLDADELSSGEVGLAQLRLEEPLVTEDGDRMIIRFYSPMETIAGAVVVDAHPDSYHKRFKKDILQHLKQKETGGMKERVLDVLKKIGIANLTTLTKELKLADQAVVEGELTNLVKNNQVHLIAEVNMYVLRAEYQWIIKTTLQLIDTYLSKHKYTRFVPKAQLHSELQAASKKPSYKVKMLEAIWSEATAVENIITTGDSLVRAGYEVILAEQEQQALQRVLDNYRKAGIEVPAIKEIFAKVGGLKNEQQLVDLLMYLVEEELLIQIAEDMFYHPQTIEQLRLKLIELGKSKEKFTAADYRDVIKSSRKYAVAILEYFDRNKLTRRMGDERSLLKN